MITLNRFNHYQNNDNWKIYKKAYLVHDATIKPKVKAVCILIACSFQGLEWCQENGHTFIKLDLIDKQIVKEEYKNLKEKGVLK